MPESERIFAQAGKRLAEKTLAAAHGAASGAEFRIPFQAAIAEAARAIGAPIQPRDELGLIEGRAETLYNRLAIGRARPGSLRPSQTWLHFA